MKKWLKGCLLGIGIFLALVVAYWLVAQLLVDHSECTFTPDYDRVLLTEESDPQTVFLQTGLSPAAAAEVLEQEGLVGLVRYQDAFFGQKEVACTPMFWFFCREDRQLSPTAPAMAQLQPGDILITRCTHTAGWRHGHAALVVREDRILELAVIGTRSARYDPAGWEPYSQYAVLRLKDRTPEFQEALLSYVDENLMDVPYSLVTGFFGPKAMDREDPDFSLMCTTLVWYPFYKLGYDLDSDGGRVVSSLDILESPYLEVVQVYGMDPRNFQDRMAE